MTLNKLFGNDNQSVGYWWLTANPKMWSFSNLSVGEEQSYTLYNDNGNKKDIRNVSEDVVDLLHEHTKLL